SGGGRERSERTRLRCFSGGGRERSERTRLRFFSGGGRERSERARLRFFSGGGRERSERTRLRFFSGGGRERSERTRLRFSVGEPDEVPDEQPREPGHLRGARRAFGDDLRARLAETRELVGVGVGPLARLVGRDLQVKLDAADAPRRERLVLAVHAVGEALAV